MSFSVDGKDIWRKIPPEDKIAGMSKAQSSGFMAATILIIVCSTLAVGFKAAWLMWVSILASPIAFQFASSRAWRDIRPRMMLEYLAARSAARRHAFNAGGKNLELSLMFKGRLEEEFEDEQENIQAEIDNRKVNHVWVALLADSFVIMSERVGGAELRFSHLVNEKLTMTNNEDEVGDYSNDKELTFVSRERQWVGHTFKLTSNYPAALIAFEKGLQDKIAEVQGASNLGVSVEVDEGAEFPED